MQKGPIVFMILLCGMCAVFAQDGTSSMAPRYSGDRELTIPVKVWGEVERPGIFNVPIGYDMLGILSIAGGPKPRTAKMTNVKVIRGQRLNEDEPLVIFVDLESYIETGDDSLIPEIRRGDTIMIPPKFGKNFVQNFASLLAIAQSITIIAYYIDRVAE